MSAGKTYPRKTYELGCSSMGLNPPACESWRETGLTLSVYMLPSSCPTGLFILFFFFFFPHVSPFFLSSFPHPFVTSAGWIAEADPTLEESDLPLTTISGISPILGLVTNDYLSE